MSEKNVYEFVAKLKEAAMANELTDDGNMNAAARQNVATATTVEDES